MSTTLTNAILQAASVAYVLADHNLQIIEAGGAEQLLPASPPTLIGARLLDVLPALRSRAPKLAALLAGSADVLRWEQHAPNKAALCCSVAPLGVPGALLVTIGLREAPQRQHRRRTGPRVGRRAERRPEEPGGLVPLLLAATMHEMRTPLTVATGYLSLLLDKACGPLTVQQAEALDAVDRNVQQIQQLTADLLDTARIGSGQLVLRPRVVDLRRVIARVIDDYGPQLAERRQHASLDAPHDLPHAWCDELRVTQILMNLIGNASKYSPDGGRIAVSVRGNAASGFVQIAVADSGIGITPGDQQHVFTPFYRASNTRQSTAGGSGLGLYVTRALVEAHGGSIWLTSAPQVGSTFYLTLPQSAQVAEQACDASR
jgi:signal transduction histidine kinase